MTDVRLIVQTARNQAEAKIIDRKAPSKFQTMGLVLEDRRNIVSYIPNSRPKSRTRRDTVIRLSHMLLHSRMDNARETKAFDLILLTPSVLNRKLCEKLVPHVLNHR